MQKTANLQLSQFAIAAALKIGGPTFSPRARNRMICNQAPELGLISARQADSIRSQVHPRIVGSKSAKKKVFEVHIRRTTYPAGRTTCGPNQPRSLCKGCNSQFKDPKIGQQINCHCGCNLLLLPEGNPARKQATYRPPCFLLIFDLKLGIMRKQIYNIYKPIGLTPCRL